MQSSSIEFINNKSKKDPYLLSNEPEELIVASFSRNTCCIESVSIKANIGIARSNWTPFAHKSRANPPGSNTSFMNRELAWTREPRLNRLNSSSDEDGLSVRTLLLPCFRHLKLNIQARLYR